ncbi:MAG: hypothetical protein NT069_32825 [Planctomycetota bacterium]|nr:hypothetical protein [Planctomycetota bacterium]
MGQIPDPSEQSVTGQLSLRLHGEHQPPPGAMGGAEVIGDSGSVIGTTAAAIAGTSTTTPPQPQPPPRPPAPLDCVAMAEKALRALLVSDGLDPTDCFELRIDYERNGYKQWQSGYFRPGDFRRMATIATEWSRKPDTRAVYFTLNPVKSIQYAVSPNSVKFAKGGGGQSSDDDVSKRHLLLIDFDPCRGGKQVSSTKEEKIVARTLAEKVVEWLTEIGFPGAVFSDSGNGYHALYRIDLPNNNESTELVKRFLYALDQKFSIVDECKVDTTVFNAGRICKLYFTMTRKGGNVPERPHRLSRVLTGPPTLEVVSRELLEKVSGTLPDDAGANGSTATSTAGGSGSGAGIAVLASDRFATVALGCIVKNDFSVQGQQGSNTCISAAGFLTHSCSMPADQALGLMRIWNQSNATPPWSDAELARKVEESFKNPRTTKPFGWFRDKFTDGKGGKGDENGDHGGARKGAGRKKKPAPSNQPLKAHPAAALYESPRVAKPGPPLPSPPTGKPLASLIAAGAAADSEGSPQVEPVAPLDATRSILEFPSIETINAEVEAQINAQDSSDDSADPSGDPFEPFKLGPHQIALSHVDQIVNNDALKRLHMCDNLYQRGSQLVVVIAGSGATPDGDQRIEELPHIVPLEESTLAHKLSEIAEYGWIEEDKDGVPCGFKPERPPLWHLKYVLAARQYPENVRKLQGISASPVLRRDGSIALCQGYDPLTRMYLALDKSLELDIPEEPTEADAFERIRILTELVSDFPFTTPAHRSGWIAGLLTSVSRHLMECAPLFLFDACVKGAGKSLLANLISWIALGRDMPGQKYPNENAECEKIITSFSLQGKPLVLLDNIDVQFGCSSLNSALTSASWTGRILGLSKMFTGSLRITWLASGINVVVQPEMSRRIVHVRMDPTDEAPEKRSSFKIENIVQHVRDHRGAYLSAALTILSAYLRAGKPVRQKLPTWGSFEEWSALIRGAIVWAGQPDPNETRNGLSEDSDSETGSIAGLFEALYQLTFDGGGYTVHEMLTQFSASDISDRFRDLREAVLDLCGVAAGKLPSPRSLGNNLKALRNRIVGDKRLTVYTGGQRKRYWRVVVIGSQHDVACDVNEDPVGGELAGEELAPVGGDATQFEFAFPGEFSLDRM